MGRMIESKFLKITGRIKEQFKLTNGKYVVPSLLEDYICRSRYVAQTLLYGDNRKWIVALIVPDVAEIKVWADTKNLKVCSALIILFLQFIL